MKRDPFKLRAIFEARRGGQQQHKVKLCDVCGQAFATTDLDEVFHHGPEPHAPSAARPEAGPVDPARGFAYASALRFSDL